MRGWLVAASLSLALHAVAALAVMQLLRPGAGLPMLFVDLSALDLPAERPVAAPAERSGARPPQLTASETSGARGLAPAPGPRPEPGTGGAGRAAPRAPEPIRVAASPAEPRAQEPPRIGDGGSPPTDVAQAVTRDATRTPGPPAEAVPAPASSAGRPEERAPQPPVVELSRPLPSPAERGAVAHEPGARDSLGAGRSTAAAADGAPPSRPPGRWAGGASGRAAGTASDAAGGGRWRAPLEGGSGSGGGQSFAATGAGSGTAGAEYGSYLAQWRRRIHENLRYPMAARRRSLTGTVQLEILIRPDGAVASVDIAESSTHGALDAAALEAVRSLPALPFPPHLAPRPLRARLPVVFDLR